MLQKIQRFGGAMFAPAMLFSISGLMVGVSALATTADIVGDLAVYGTPWYAFWIIIQRGSWTVFKRLPLLFAVALPIGLAQKQPARCCLEALVAYFAYCFFLSEIIKLSGDNLGLKYPSSLTSASGITIIDGIKTLDTGIIGPLAVSATVVAIHDRFYDAKIPDWLGTFSGSSLVYLISFFAVFALAAISAAIVPYVYDVTDTLRHALAGIGPFGVGIFVFLERALEPFGLHHLLYMPIYYDNLVINDGIYATWSSLLPILSHSTRPLNELAPWAGFTATGWVKLFGLPAIAAAFYSTAKPERRAGLRVILAPAIIASVVCGVTEPLEFLFMFTHPGLFLLYAVLSSCLATTMNLFGIVGIFSGGLMEMAAFNFIPLMRTHAGAYLLALGIGLAFSLIFFVSFRALILVYDLKTPGREDHVANRAAIDCLTGSDFAKEQSPNDEVDSRSDQDHVLAERVIQLLGGVGNIVGATNCATRLRVEAQTLPSLQITRRLSRWAPRASSLRARPPRWSSASPFPALKSILTRSWASRRNLCPPPRPPLPPAQPISAALFASSISTERSPGKTPGSPKTFPKTSGTSPPIPTRRFRRQSASLSPTATWPLSARDAP